MTHKLLHFTLTTISIQNSESKFLSSQINVYARKSCYCPGKEMSFAFSVKRYRMESDALHLVDLMEFIKKIA